MSRTQGRGFAWASALVVLLSAFLLFQVQPIISKLILPWFGGSPAVWTTCMLFFQVVLLGGYAYAHWLTRMPQPGHQAIVHLVVLGFAILLLPIMPADTWKPSGSAQPTGRILVLLTCCVGLPYFTLASTGPLIQAWFARTCPGRSPYWLYALSNIGSLAALLTYPFVFEPMWTSRFQGAVWSSGFGLFAIACGVLAVSAWRFGSTAALDPEAPNRREASGDIASGRTVGSASNRASQPAKNAESAKSSKNAKSAENAAENAELADTAPGLSDRLIWLFLPALASTLLLAITNHLCQDVAVVPFMWVAPLSLYLLSFILVFAGRWWYWRTTNCVLAALAILGVSALQQHKAVSDMVLRFGWTARLEALDAKLIEWARGAGLNPLLNRLGLYSFSLESLNECIVTHSAIFLSALFFGCMVCHGEMVRRKPAPEHLTRFYLMTSAGGALGGIFVALVCPAIFATYLELNWSLTVAYVVIAMVLISMTFVQWRTAETRLKQAGAFALGLLFLAVAGGAGVVGRAQVEAFDTNDLATARSFYGVLHVEESISEDLSWNGRELLNGRILHGFQFVEQGRSRLPTTYYTRRSGAGVTIETLRSLAAGVDTELEGLLLNSLIRPQSDDDADDGGVVDELMEDFAPIDDKPRNFRGQQPLRVAVVGLGVGTMAAYGEPGDTFRFYEINPLVERFARTYFTYLKNCPAHVEVVLGDARLSMEREEPQEYDAIILDAFSGDAIPAHLLTAEALRIYQRHLKPTGVVAIHVSNRHLDLVPVVATLSRHVGMQVCKVANSNDRGSQECTSDWMLVTSNKKFLEHQYVIEAASGLSEERFQGPLWTDQFSNLLDILK